MSERETLRQRNTIPQQRIPVVEQEHRPDTLPPEEYIPHLFVSELSQMVEQGISSTKLATYIDTSFSREPYEGASSLREDLAAILSASDTSSNIVFDHKLEQDTVFAVFISTLRETKSLQHELHEQRRAALKLADLRSILPDSTDYDDDWIAVLHALFMKAR